MCYNTGSHLDPVSSITLGYLLGNIYRLQIVGKYIQTANCWEIYTDWASLTVHLLRWEHYAIADHQLYAPFCGRNRLVISTPTNQSVSLSLMSFCSFHPMPEAAVFNPHSPRNKHLPSRWEAVRTSANPFALESEPRSCPWRCGATRSQAWTKINDKTPRQRIHNVSFSPYIMNGSNKLKFVPGTPVVM